MLKKELMKKFQKDPNRFWKVDLFADVGFKRKLCKSCGKFFWTLTEQEICNDASCRPYEFIGDPPISKKFSYFSAWNAIEGFFKKNGHVSLKRYPVVCRWYPLYFTIAGIVDFYRIENSGISFEYPATSTIMPQICLRFNNIPNVGVTGRADTSFCMVQQTSFYGGKKGYWKDQAIDLDYRMLTQVFGIKPEDITFIEDTWMGDSAFGTSLEFHVKGLELGNCVFTEFSGTPEKFTEMKEKVIDMGAGLERYVWISQGTPTLYDAVSGPVIEKLKRLAGVKYDDTFLRYSKLAGRLNLDDIPDVDAAFRGVAKELGVNAVELRKQIDSIRGIFSVADHAKTLLFAINDGVLFSNVRGGYNLRVVFRRALNFIDKFGFPFDIYSVAEDEARFLKPMHPELAENLGRIIETLKIESGKYKEMKSRTSVIISSVIKSNTKLTESKLVELYDSNGITPEALQATAEKEGMKVNVPSDFYAKITEMHMKEKDKAEKEPDIGIPKGVKGTKMLYYDFAASAEANVLFAKGKYFVLDRTPFYPESGGQVQDTGTVNEIRVVDVRKMGDIVVHVADKNTGFKKGKKVIAVVDDERRRAIIAHHTATHMIGAACRRVLGPHVWQEGSKKEHDKAHLDITHYDALKDEELRRIEDLVNGWLRNGIKVSVQEMSRGEAESRYGFILYQGHGVPSKVMRIVTIKTLDNELIDAEACGGLHAIGKENYIGLVKIIGTSRIHDGIDRIEFVAGPAALKTFQKEHSMVEGLSTRLNVEIENIGRRIDELLAENSLMHKQIGKTDELIAMNTANSIEDADLIEKEIDFSRKTLIKIADLLVKRNENCAVLLRNREGDLVCMTGAASKMSAIDLLGNRLKGRGFKGGGSKRFAQGKVKVD